MHLKVIYILHQIIKNFRRLEKRQKGHRNVDEIKTKYLLGFFLQRINSGNWNSEHKTNRLAI